MSQNGCRYDTAASHCISSGFYEVSRYLFSLSAYSPKQNKKSLHYIGNNNVYISKYIQKKKKKVSKNICLHRLTGTTL